MGGKLWWQPGVRAALLSHPNTQFSLEPHSQTLFDLNILQLAKSPNTIAENYLCFCALGGMQGIPHCLQNPGLPWAGVGPILPALCHLWTDLLIRAPLDTSLPQSRKLISL